MAFERCSESAADDAVSSGPPGQPAYDPDGVDDLGRAFADGEIPVTVYGLGKMGLPIAAIFADVTGAVTGVDVDESVVESVAAGECHVGGEPGLPDLVVETVAEGALHATTDGASAAAGARVHVVIVPTLLDDDDRPDLTSLEAVVATIGRGLDPGDLVLIESTVPPKTCRDVVEPSLAAESGLDSDAFGVAFCPERTASGRALRDIRGAYPKIVGGVDERSTRAAGAIYDEITDNDVVSVSDATTAECVKVFEGVYRDVNIALANELATVADDLGIDVVEAIDAANTQPYCDIHDPGPGVGGHCIPVYPFFLTERVAGDLELVRTARTVNDRMPSYVVRQVLAFLDERGVPVPDASVLLLGVTYRAGVEEARNAPARDIAAGLTARNATVYAVDPVLEGDQFAGLDVRSISTARVTDRHFDVAVLVTAHDEFADVAWNDVADGVLDCRRAVDEGAIDEDAVAVRAIGRPGTE